ncbi:predicted protein [Lichtheimia corymbifera JMRC:FSU:9682]|uniref:Uncharacterized protein n=1 Tax=Lichtheimia corymbifera JMRC:FSU:9682 TaxID=1263082 RepID=A0A068SE29_9FUNG|nr:predicted protein [Lichtheimia corymbifera JMRC:FSU:9682]
MGSSIEQSCATGRSAPCVEVSRSSWPFSDSPNVTTSQSRKKIQEVDLRSTLAAGDIAKSRIGEPDRETCTQGALHPDEQLRSIKDPRFHCKVQRYSHLYVLHML